jgi:DNA polymerase-3 subunit delta'
MSLSSLLGHEQPIRLLRRAFAEGRIPNAYLFVGPPNLGKFTIASEFARLLNCENQSDSTLPDLTDSCGICESCRRIAAGNDPDVLAIRPLTRIGTGAKVEVTEFEGAVLTTDQVGEILARAGMRRTRARYKVLIISRAETMNAEAANRLLKTLEEPPEGTVLVLTCSNPSALLPTIASRCQRVAFHPVPLSVLEPGLAARFPDLDPDLVATAARLCSGRPGWALTLLQSPGALNVRRRLFDMLAALPADPLVSALAAAEELLRLSEAWWIGVNGEGAQEVLRRAGDRSRRVALADLFDLLSSALRDVLLLTVGEEGLLINRDALPLLRDLARVTTPAKARLALSALQQVQRHIRGNANLRLAAELVLLQIMRVLRAPVEA